MYRDGICTYCGNEGLVNKDHIPPKAFFPKPRPSNLITVPSCEACNNGSSSDDEYLSTIYGMIDGIPDIKVARSLEERNIRNFKRVESFKFINALASDIKKRPIYSSRGIYLGKKATIEVDKKREDLVLKRIVKGLYFHHFEKRLCDHGLSIELIDTKEITSKEEDLKLANFASIIINHNATHRFYIDGVFSSFALNLEEQGNIGGIVIMSFYTKVQYIALITR